MAIELKPWLPKELQKWGYARKVLGLLLHPEVAQSVNKENYPLYYEDKVLELLQGKEENPAEVLDNLLAAGLSPEVDSDPDSLVAAMLEEEEWQGPLQAMNSYLRGSLKLEDLKEELNLQEQNSEPVSEEEFRKELEELTLREFMEMTVSF